MKEKFYTLHENVEVEEIQRALEETYEDLIQETEMYGDLLYYDGNNVEAVFSEDRAYLRRENGASCLGDIAILAFIQYESEHQLGSRYLETTRTNF